MILPFSSEQPITVTADFYTYNPNLWRLKYHLALDFGLMTGTKLVACREGKIVAATQDSSPNGGYGNYLLLQSGSLVYLYAHLNQFSCRTGDKVAAGQLIGLSGNSGHSTGPHLHFQVMEFKPDAYGILDKQASVNPAFIVNGEMKPLKQGDTVKSQ